jgi:hypothetical protein
MNWVQRIRNWSGRSDFEHTVKFCLFSKETQSIALNSIYAGVNAKVAYLEYVYLQAVQLAYINACAVMVTVSKNRPAGTKMVRLRVAQSTYYQISIQSGKRKSQNR